MFQNTINAFFVAAVYVWLCRQVVVTNIAGVRKLALVLIYAAAARE